MEGSKDRSCDRNQEVTFRASAASFSGETCQIKAIYSKQAAAFCIIDLGKFNLPRIKLAEGVCVIDADGGIKSEDPLINFWCCDPQKSH